MPAGAVLPGALPVVGEDWPEAAPPPGVAGPVARPDGVAEGAVLLGGVELPEALFCFEPELSQAASDKAESSAAATSHFFSISPPPFG